MDAIRSVDPAGARDLVAAGARLLDVRDDHEWSAGRAPGALHVALADLPDRVDSLDRERAIVCVCRSGGRSARATEYLVEQGFAAVNLDGGMHAWALAGLDMEGDGPEAVVV